MRTLKQKARDTKAVVAFDAGYMFPFACFACRKSFKRPYAEGLTKRKCPHCGGTAVMLDRKFKPPAATDLKQWRKVEQLVAAGFRFAGARRRYPEKLSEVAAFVEEHERRASGIVAVKSRVPRKRSK